MNNQNISNWCHFLLRLIGKRKRRKEREVQVEERGKNDARRQFCRALSCFAHFLTLASHLTELV